MLKKFLTKLGAIIVLLSLLPSFASAQDFSDNADLNNQFTQSAEQDLQFFYQQPSWSKLQNLTSTLIRIPGGEELLLTFTTMVFATHPDYVPLAVKNFPDCTAKEQKLLYTALTAAGYTDATKTIADTYHYTTSLPHFYTAQQINNLIIADKGENLDELWAAFFATGDDRYLIKILQYVTADKTILIFSYEIVNRQYLCAFSKNMGTTNTCKNLQDLSDIMTAIKKRYPNNTKQMQEKVAAVASALWSLESNRHLDRTLDKKINALIKAEPQLDYWKIIKTTTGA